MAGKWRQVSIGELAEIYDGPHATPPKTNDGPVFLGISNLASGRIDLANSEHLSEDDYVRWTRRVEPVEGDVVFSYETRLGEAAIIPYGLRCCLGPRMGLLRARQGKVDKRFLLYAYLGPQFQETLRSRTIHGSTVDRIPLIDMPSFPIEVPASIHEQRAIAHILGTLDDKIELNRRMSETLEAMARALFKSWFVDFDPVRAKMNLPSPPGRGAGGEGTKPAMRANAPIPTQLLDFARQLRRQATDAENLLWRLLRGRQIANAKFRRQHSFPPYVLDFYCHELKLAVELDGGQLNEEVGRRRDARRDEYLASHGIRVLRFWNNDVLRETEAVLEAIYAAVVECASGVPSPPAPLPMGEGRVGLFRDLADLFPARFVDSELGEIPEGWAVGCVDDEFDLTMGQSPPGETYNESGEGLPFYQGRADFGSRFPTRRVYCTAPTRLARAGDTLISVRAPVGDINMATENCAIGRGVAAARHRSGSRSYSYQFKLGLEEAFGRFEAEGTVFGSIGKKDFHAISCVRPPRVVIAEFEAKLSPIDSRIDVTDRESRTLAGLRDALLPKLISGELRVQEVERFIGSAV